MFGSPSSALRDGGREKGGHDTSSSWLAARDNNAPHIRQDSDHVCLFVILMPKTCV